jgi:hypothetical protein
MLEPIRHYAAEHLEQSVEATAMRRGRAAYYLRHAEHSDSQLRTATQLIWFDRLEDEQANLRVALGWFWSVRGYLSEGRMWLERALLTQKSATTQVTGVAAVAEARTPSRAMALNRAGLLAWLQGDFLTARQQFAESLTLSQTRGSEADAAFALACLAAATYDRTEYPALRARLEESVTQSRAAGDKWGAAYALALLGHGLFEPGGVVAYRRNLESAR